MNWLKEKLQDLSPWTTLMLSSIIGSTVFLGAAADFWWHFHGLEEEIFSNAHLILLGGLALNVVWTCALWYSKISFRGMNMSGAGIVLFIVSFGGDFFSHSYWGFEMGVESVYSLSHLGIVIAILLINYGWAKSALDWAIHTHQRFFTGFLPAAISLSATVGIIWLLLVVAMPQHVPLASNFYRPVILDEVNAISTSQGYKLPGQTYGEDVIYFDSQFYFYQSMGTLSIMFFSILLVGTVLRLNRVFLLPFGVISTVITIGSIVLALGNDHFNLILPGIFIAFAADLVMQVAWQKRWSQYVLAIAVPIFYFEMYFVTLYGSPGVWWGVPQVAGVIFWSGLIGALVCWLVGDLRIKEGYKGIYTHYTQ